MAAYVKLTNFAVKDGLLSGNPLKVVTGAELDDEFNAIAASSSLNYTDLNTAADAIALKYAFSNSTTMADPGTGVVRFNNATLASVTAIAIDDLNSSSQDVSAYITSWDDSTSTNKGTIVLRQGTTVQAIYNITGLTDNSGWTELAVTYVTGSGSFVDGTTTYAQFNRAGDLGTAATIAVGNITTGAPGSSATVTNTGSSTAAVFDFTIPRGDVGATGATGSTGAAGADGKTWLNGSGAPSDGSGVNGDFYLDTTADAYYGPKAGGTWAGTGPTSLIGPAGSGDVDGPSSSVDGEVALFDSTTGKLLKRATGSGIAKLTSGVLGTATAGTDYGYVDIPQSGSDKTTSYSLATSDNGKFIGVGSGGSITIPDATFSAGNAVTIFNNTTGNVTITCTITTAYIAGTDSDKATMTLATRGVANILFLSGTVCVVTGNVS